MDAIALLKEDHAKAKKLMNELEQTTERGVKTREEKWTKLLKELTIHENTEEEIFYPALHEHSKLKDRVLARDVAARRLRADATGATRVWRIVAFPPRARPPRAPG